MFIFRGTTSIRQLLLTHFSDIFARMRSNGRSRGGLIFSLKTKFLRQFCQTTSAVFACGGFQPATLLLYQLRTSLLLLSNILNFADYSQFFRDCQTELSYPAQNLSHNNDFSECTLDN